MRNIPPFSCSPCAQPSLRRTALRRAAALLAAALGVPAWTHAHAQTPQDWPSKPIRFVVGYPVGSSPAALTRRMAADSKLYGGVIARIGMQLD